MNDSYLCIDIGTSSIKVLEKDFSGKVLKWGYLERKDKPLHTSISPLKEEEVTDFLKKLLSEMAVEAKEAVVALPSFLVFTAITDSPDPKHIPAATGSFQLGAVKIGGGKFFLAAVPNEIVEKYKRICDALEINILRFEPESVPLARVHGKVYEPTLIVDIGHRSTNFTLACRGQVYFSSHTDFALASGTPNVIMEKAKEIAETHGAKNIVSSKTFSVTHGL